MGFRFFQNNDRDMDAEFERMLQLNFPAADGELPQTETLGRYDPDGTASPAVFTSVLRNRNDISDEAFDDICKAQRVQLIERMFEYLFVTHTIVSQDENGFTIRTELNL
jgi:hypothetical protein